MPSERFEVGKSEKHFITVELDMISKRMKIEQDEVVVKNDLHTFSPLNQKFKLNIGSSEKHHVEITAGPFHQIELKVDGKKFIHCSDQLWVCFN